MHLRARELKDIETILLFRKELTFRIVLFGHELQTEFKTVVKTLHGMNIKIRAGNKKERRDKIEIIHTCTQTQKKTLHDK